MDEPAPFPAPTLRTPLERRLALLVLVGLFVLTATLNLLVISAIKVAAETKQLVQESRKAVFEASYLLNDNLLYARGTMTEFQESSVEWRKLLSEQRRELQESSRKMNRILASFESTAASADRLVVRLDSNLNDELLPAATYDLRQLATILSALHDSSLALKALARDPRNAELQEQALLLTIRLNSLAAQGEETLAAAEATLEETKKVPPTVRKALWISAAGTAISTLWSIISGQ